MADFGEAGAVGKRNFTHRLNGLRKEHKPRNGKSPWKNLAEDQSMYENEALEYIGKVRELLANYG